MGALVGNAVGASMGALVGNAVGASVGVLVDNGVGASEGHLSTSTPSPGIDNNRKMDEYESICLCIIIIIMAYMVK
jgi:outer membrane lipoprotein SlyB